MDQTNAIRTAVESGDPVVGAQVATASPAVVETYGAAGLDFAWVDLEHAGPSPYDSRPLEDLTRAAEAADVELVVRVPTGEPAAIRKVLDAGVRTVVVPRVETAAEVRRAAEATRFAYDGGPGGRAPADARVTTWGAETAGHATTEDANVWLGVVVETTAALENLDAILAVPDLGFVVPGVGDLSVALGHPLETDHPDVREQVERIERAARRAGVPLGGVAGGAEDVAEALEAGYLFVLTGSELAAAREAMASRVEAAGSLFE